MGFKKKATIALAAFLVIVAAACVWRSASDAAEEAAKKAEQAEQKQAAEAGEEPGGRTSAVDPTDAAAASLSDMLASYSWVGASGAVLDIREGVASLRSDGGQASEKEFSITSAEHFSDSDGEAWRASVEVDGKASVLEAGKPAGSDSWNMTCAALGSGAFTTAAAHGDPVVDPVPDAFAALIGDDEAEGIRGGVKAFVSEQYPSAATAVAQKTATMDLEHGTATLSWKLDNKAATTVSAVVSLSGDGYYEISGGR